MKYLYHNIVFSEIPDEVSLSLSISGCTRNCSGCHTSELRGDVGDVLDENEIDKLMDKYGDHITCILFLGGDQFHLEMKSLFEYIRSKYSLKIALYSGANDISSELVNLLDYVKMGPYDKDLGGLDKKTTNQKLYKISESGLFKNITEKFWL